MTDTRTPAPADELVPEALPVEGAPVAPVEADAALDTDVPAEDLPAEPEPVEAAPKSRKALWIAIIAAVVLALIGMALAGGMMAYRAVSNARAEAAAAQQQIADAQAAQQAAEAARIAAEQALLSDNSDFAYYQVAQQAGESFKIFLSPTNLMSNAQAFDLRNAHIYGANWDGTWKVNLPVANGTLQVPAGYANFAELQQWLAGTEISVTVVSDGPGVYGITFK